MLKSSLKIKNTTKAKSTYTEIKCFFDLFFFLNNEKFEHSRAHMKKVIGRFVQFLCPKNK